MVKIIGIVGKAGSGKDTAADILIKNHNFCKIAFADPLKRFCKELFDFSEDQLWGSSDKRSVPDERYLRQTDDGEKYLTPRFALQRIGTEGVRFAYKDAWVDYTIRKINQL